MSVHAHARAFLSPFRGLNRWRRKPQGSFFTCCLSRNEHSSKSTPPPPNEQEDDTGVAEVKVTMPFTLKKQLVTDWENVTQEPRRLVKLPRELTAADVMKQYMDSKANRSTTQQTARAQELMDGVRIYFDKVRPGAKPSYRVVVVSCNLVVAGYSGMPSWSLPAEKWPVS